MLVPSYMPVYYSPYGWRWECQTHPLVQCLRNGELLWRRPSSLPLRSERWARSYWPLSDQRQQSLSSVSLNPLQERERDSLEIDLKKKEKKKSKLLCNVVLSFKMYQTVQYMAPLRSSVTVWQPRMNLLNRMSLSQTHHGLLCCYWLSGWLLP